MGRAHLSMAKFDVLNKIASLIIMTIGRIY
jgi:hypothetical protein